MMRELERKLHRIMKNIANKEYSSIVEQWCGVRWHLNVLHIEGQCDNLPSRCFY